VQPFYGIYTCDEPSVLTRCTLPDFVQDLYLRELKTYKPKEVVGWTASDIPASHIIDVM
jgi:hypothetical protein